VIGIRATNITGNTKHYLSTLATLRAVFPLVQVYPDWRDAGGAQSIIVADRGRRRIKRHLASARFSRRRAFDQTPPRCASASEQTRGAWRAC
jgi:hypothetical protein